MNDDRGSRGSRGISAPPCGTRAERTRVRRSRWRRASAYVSFCMPVRGNRLTSTAPLLASYLSRLPSVAEAENPGEVADEFSVRLDSSKRREVQSTHVLSVVNRDRYRRRETEVHEEHEARAPAGPHGFIPTAFCEEAKRCRPTDRPLSCFNRGIEHVQRQLLNTTCPRSPSRPCCPVALSPFLSLAPFLSFIRSLFVPRPVYRSVLPAPLVALSFSPSRSHSRIFSAPLVLFTLPRTENATRRRASAAWSA
ncbi:hypothetical protein PUN28_004472 [Cardiocondyla obscurior]|uniref:Transmembrane protein n=1 Tax=Cardiocondyla obscurior TaxID=286306 RepID=A0AAW2GBG9_9HYME